MTTPDEVADQIIERTKGQTTDITNYLSFRTLNSNYHDLTDYDDKREWALREAKGWARIYTVPYIWQAKITIDEWWGSDAERRAIEAILSILTYKLPA